MTIVTPVLTFFALFSGMAGLPQPTSFGIYAAQNGHTGVVYVGFDDLEESRQRRLTYYSTNILANISEMALLERAGDQAAVERKLYQTRQLASRLETTANEYGLTRGEMLAFFLELLASELRGPLPRAILTADGQFSVPSLFETAMAEPAPDSANGDYVDLLRGADVGGVAGDN